jgi:hypothetical protein
MESAAYFRKKATQCRRLADTIVDQDDPAVQGLLRLAEEFEARVAPRKRKPRRGHGRAE